MPMAFKHWLSDVWADRCFVLSPHVQNKLPDETLPTQASIVLLLGPEGGLSPQEVDMALQRGFSPLSLGPRVLRTETATMAAMTVLQYRYGDFS